MVCERYLNNFFLNDVFKIHCSMLFPSYAPLHLSEDGEELFPQFAMLLMFHNE